MDPAIRRFAAAATRCGALNPAAAGSVLARPHPTTPRLQLAGPVAVSIDQLAAALADRYTIGEELGRGGMATVYRAHDIRHDRPVAIKVMRPEVSAELAEDRFLREIRTTANLQHPHIVPVFDSGSAEGQLFFVMPLIDGESLRDRLDRDGTLPVDEAIRLIRGRARVRARQRHPAPRPQARERDAEPGPRIARGFRHRAHQ